MGFNPKTYRLDTHPDLAQLLFEALNAMADGRAGIFVECDSPKALCLKLSRYRKAHEAQHEGIEEYEHRYKGLVFIPKETGVEIRMAVEGHWNITPLED